VYRPLGKYPAVAFVLFGTITAGLGLLAIPTAVTTPPAVAATQASGVIPAPPRPAHQSKLVRARRAGPKVSRTLPDTPRHAHSAHPAKRVRPGRAFHPPAVKEACALPSAVSGVTAKAGANQATLSWTAASNGGSPLTAYVVRELTGGNVGQSLATAGTSTSLIMTGLAGGKAATFSVVAENSCGAGPAVTSPAATPTGSGTTYAATVIADKPSVYYRLAETSGTVMADSSGTAQDGTYDPQTVLGQPGALLSDPAAPSAEESSSDSDPVGSSPASLPQFNDPRSVSVWVNSTATDNPLVVAWGSPGTDQSFIVGFDQSAITVDGDNDYHVIPTAHPVADGFWHLITVSYDGSVISAYLDGRLQGTAHFDAALATFGSSLALGASPYYYNRYVGNLQDVAIYPAPLTASQVSAQYAASGYAVPGAPPAVHAAPAGPNAAQISWGATSDLADPISSFLVTASTGPNAGMSVSVPGDATAARLTGLAAGTDQFTVTAANESGTGAAGTTNSYTVPGAAATYASTVRSAGAVAFDRLGDGSVSTLTDSSNGRATGSYSSDVTLGAAGPLQGDGTTSATAGPSGAIAMANGTMPLYDAARTAEAWFRTTAPAGSNGYSYQALVSWGESNNDQAFMIGVAPDAIWVDGWNDAHSFSTPYPVNDGAWHFVVVSYSGTTMTVYLDGVAIGTGSFAQPLDTLPPATAASGQAPGLYLGQDVSVNGYPIAPLQQGSLADVAVFPSVLPASQIASQFTQSGLGKPAVPSSVTASAGKNQATVHWQAAAAPGAKVLSYLVTALSGGSTAANAVAVPGIATSAVITGLAAGTSYGFRVQAQDSYGVGPAGTTTATISPTGSATTYVSTVLSQGPAAYYRLGDSTDALMADSSGHGLNGTYSTAGVTLGQPGALPGDADTAALIDDGYSGIGTASGTLPLGNSARSVVAWFTEPSGADDQGALVSWGQPGTDQAFQLMVSGTSQVSVDGWNDTHSFSTPYPVDDGAWHQLAVSYTGSTFTLFLDGVPIGSGSFGGTLATATSPLYLGGGGTLSPGPSGMTLDEVSVYATALTAANISAQFTAAGYARPAAPAGLSAQAGANRATITWAAGPSSVHSYQVTALAGGSRAGDSVSVPGTATSAVVGGLAAGTSYTFRVTGWNEYGQGSPAVSASVTPTGTVTTYSTTVLADKPSAYYRLSDSSETVMPDSSASQVNGSYDASNFTEGATGPVAGDPSTAITLNNGDAAGQANAILPLYNAARTVEAWFNIPSGQQPSGTLAGWGQTNTDEAFDCGISATAITVDGWGDSHSFTTPYPLNDGNWHQLAVSYDGTTITAYLDGQPIGTSQFDSALNTQASPLFIGSGPAGYDGPGDNVALGQVSVYPAALTAARIAAHFAAAGYAAPSAPTGVTASAGANQATVGWTAASAHGAPVTSYLVTAYSGSTAEYSKAVPGTASSAVITGLPGNVAFTFHVVARNPYGAGPAGVSAAVTPTGSSTTYASGVLADAPSAYYRLGDTTTSVLADSSGKNGPGVYNAGQVTLGVPGAITGDSDTAVTGTGGEIGTASPSLPTEQHARTVTAWVQTTDGGQQFIAGWGSTSDSEGFSVGFDANDIYVDEYGSTLTFTTTANISNGSWHQIAVTATATSATAYLDGTSLGTQSFPVSLDTAPGPLQVGAAVWGSSGIDGNLDELAIFPSVLSPAKIATLHGLTHKGAS
jgi:hypothetical protein